MTGFRGWTLVTLIVCSSARPAAADEPGERPPPLEEPALRPRGADGTAGPSVWTRRPRGPRLEVSWRTFDLAEMAGRRGRYHMFAADYFFLSGVLRAAAGLEGGFVDGPRGNFLVGTDLRLGVQWPSRITPSLDLVIGLGVLRQDVLHDSLVGFAWQAGLEAGVHVFVHEWLFFSAAVGWRRLGYRQPGNDQVEPLNLFNDTLSVRVGLGF